jgi:hypothetical protein
MAAGILCIRTSLIGTDYNKSWAHCVPLIVQLRQVTGN